MTEEYAPIVGRGGVRYMKYHYNEDEWEEFVASQPDGVLRY